MTTLLGTCDIIDAPHPQRPECINWKLVKGSIAALVAEEIQKVQDDYDIDLTKSISSNMDVKVVGDIVHITLRYMMPPDLKYVTINLIQSKE